MGSTGIIRNLEDFGLFFEMCLIHLVTSTSNAKVLSKASSIGLSRTSSKTYIFSRIIAVNRIKPLAARSTNGIVTYIYLSPHVRESTKVLDSGSQPLPASGFWIPTLWIPDSNLLDSGFQNHCGFRIPVFQQQKLAGFRIPDSLTWGDTSGSKCSYTVTFSGRKL